MRLQSCDRQNPPNTIKESNEPAFLRRLRAQHGGGDSARHERPQARPRKQTKDGEEDDQPTYVMEDNHDTLSKAEYEALMRSNDAKEQEGSDSPDFPSRTKSFAAQAKARAGINVSPEQSVLMMQQAAAIGASNKKRLAKVVGEDDEEVAKPVRGESVQQKVKPKGKQRKKVKLSFDDNEANET